jgi:hypothetical protein
MGVCSMRLRIDFRTRSSNWPISTHVTSPKEKDFRPSGLNNFISTPLVEKESPIMRSIRPALRFARTLRHRVFSSFETSPRPSIFPSRPVVSRRFYSEQRESETSSKSQGGQQQEQRQHKEQQEDSEDPKKHFKEDTSPPPDPNKSPFQVFVDTFKSELAKSRELQESMKALQDESGKLGDSEALRRAKEAYARAKVFLQLQSMLMQGTI